MKIILIAPGYKPLPPQGWGAVESIVWDYYQVLSRKFQEEGQGNQVVIVNYSNPNHIVHETNSHADADVVHIMYDDYIFVAPYLSCPLILYTSHYAYITHPQFETEYSHYFQHIFKKVLENSHKIQILAISGDIRQKYIDYGFPEERVRVLSNGAREDCFRYEPTAPLQPERSIYLAKIEERKAQHYYQTIPSIDFVGNYASSPFDINSPHYLGEWDKPQLYEHLTDYANLVLLSSGEADPLVIKEALMAGLGVVISPCCTANLDLTKPFITVVPWEKIRDVEYVEGVIEENRKTSLAMRAEIRAYALERFSWDSITDCYLGFIRNCLTTTTKSG
jgi:glycosyltransferase involved in cell wall biosynthesis